MSSTYDLSKVLTSFIPMHNKTETTKTRAAAQGQQQHQTMEVDGVLKSTANYLVLQKTRPEKRNEV